MDCPGGGVCRGLNMGAMPGRKAANSSRKLTIISGELVNLAPGYDVLVAAGRPGTIDVDDTTGLQLFFVDIYYNRPTSCPRYSTYTVLSTYE